MSIFRFEYAFLISLLVGVSAIVPVVGAFIGTVPSAFLLFLVNPMQAVWFVVFIIVLQQIEGNLIYPKVVAYSKRKILIPIKHKNPNMHASSN